MKRWFLNWLLHNYQIEISSEDYVHFLKSEIIYWKSVADAHLHEASRLQNIIFQRFGVVLPEVKGTEAPSSPVGGIKTMKSLLHDKTIEDRNLAWERKMADLKEKENAS